MLSLMMPSVAFGKARQAAERALALAPDAAGAHAALALSRFGGDWDWDAAEEGFRRSLEIDPDLATSRVFYRWLLAVLGRDPAAIAEANQAVATSRSRFVHAGSALTYLMCHRYDEALVQVERCVERDPTYLYAILVRGQCFHLLRKYPEAHRDLGHAAELGQRAPHYLGLLGKSYGDAGLRDEAFAIVAELERMTRQTYVAPHCFVYVLYGLGERERALEFQERAYQDGAPPINYFTPFIRELFSLDPRHRDRLRQMRLNV
jgi:tetratricopeptide (TPR) repeat protein